MDKVMGAISGGGKASKRQAAAAQQAQAVNLARQRQDSANSSAEVANQAGMVRRTPRGRRLLLSEASTLG